MEMKQSIERIAKLRERDISPTEEDVKQKIVAPLLELLGHKPENLVFDYNTRRGGKIDVFIKNVPPDCKVIIDIKNYDENLNDCIKQIKQYTFDEDALLAILVNGSEIRIYSPLRGVAFERSLLYSIERQKLTDSKWWSIISKFLDIKNLKNRNVIKAIGKREKEIKEALFSEEHLRREYGENIEGVNNEIKTLEEEIEKLNRKNKIFAEKLKNNISQTWNALELPPPSDTTVFEKGAKEKVTRLEKEGLVSQDNEIYKIYRGIDRGRNNE